MVYYLTFFPWIIYLSHRLLIVTALRWFNMFACHWQVLWDAGMAGSTKVDIITVVSLEKQLVAMAYPQAGPSGSVLIMVVSWTKSSRENPWLVITDKRQAVLWFKAIKWNSWNRINITRNLYYLYMYILLADLSIINQVVTSLVLVVLLKLQKTFHSDNGFTVGASQWPVWSWPSFCMYIRVGAHYACDIVRNPWCETTTGQTCLKIDHPVFD